MSNIFYLRPPTRPQEQPATPVGAPPKLRVALSRVQLAAVLLKSSAIRTAPPARDVAALAASFIAPSGGDHASQRVSGRIVAAAKPVESAAAKQVSSVLANAFSPMSVTAGQLVFERPGNSGSSLSKALLRMESEFITVPDDALLARQARTNAIAFSVNSLASLAELVSGFLAAQRPMVESWAKRGGQPGLRLRYRSARPFGRIAHAGASEVTDLRAIGVSLTVEQHAGDALIIAELSMAVR